MTTFSLTLLLLTPCLVQSPLSEPSIAEQQTLGMYDVGDLVGKNGSTEIPSVGLGEARGADAERILRDVQEHQQALAEVHEQAEQLRFVVAAFMQPELTDSKETLQLLDDSLLLLQGTSRQHAWIRQFLDLQRQTSGMVEVQVKLVSVPEGHMRTLGVKSSSALFAGDDELEALTRGLEGEDIEWITAPRLVTRLRQRAQISLLKQVAYVQDYRVVVVEPGRVEVIDPVVESVQDGILLDIQNAPLEPGVFGIDLNLDLSTLERPIPTTTIQVGADRREFEIGQPRVTKINVSSKMLLRDGATALLISPDPTRDADLGVFITLHHVLEVSVDAGELEKRVREE